MIDLRIALVLAVLAVLSCVPATADTDLRMAPLNPDFVAYQAMQTDMAASAGGIQGTYGLTPSPLDLSHLDEDAGSTASMEASASSYPATFDLRDQGRVTAVRDQGTAGSCWAFATLASLESYLLPGETTDYSENNMKNLLSNSYSGGFDRAWDAGGDRGMSTAYLARWSGPVKEADDPYDQNSGDSPTGLTVRKHVQDVYFLQDRSSAWDNDEIKQFIQEDGAVYVGIYWGDDYFNPATYGYYNPGYLADGGHAIALVGWDDTYSADNFNLDPGMDGAFIAKNSWGTGWGDAGYFYISYADPTISSLTMFTAEPATNYDNIYQYDPLGWTQSFGYYDTTAWFANIFTAGGDENLDAVSFYVGQYNSPYEVYIYKDPSINDPTDGTLVAYTSGTMTMPGYHTVALPQSVPLSAGDRFSAVVKLTTPGYYYPIPVEYPIPDYSSKATASPGESYVSSDGATWEDITTSYADSNVCVKAFTTDAGQTLASIVATPATATLTVGDTQQFTATGYDSGGTVVTITPTWTSSNTTVGSISQSGLFTAIAAGTTTVSAESEGVRGTATVTVNSAPIPFINAQVSPATLVRGDKLIVSGTATADPSAVYIWIFGPDYRTLYQCVSVESDGSFEYVLPGSTTTDMPAGQYFGVVQHPGDNGMPDVIGAPTTVGAGQWINVTWVGGSSELNVDVSDLQASEAANALIDLLNE
ncbi:MAG: C1 family peptidase, partial [Methanoculleaceae archaeon]